MYAMIETRPDLAFAISQVSQFSHNPGPRHFTAIKRIFRYIAGTLDYGITYGGNHQDLTIAAQMQVTAIVLQIDVHTPDTFSCSMVGQSPGALSARHLSTTESEYMSLTQAAKEALWLRLLLTELQQLTDDWCAPWSDRSDTHEDPTPD